MAPTAVSIQSPPIGLGPRKRKTHKKSRNGCKNCKLRSVKCDEAKPSCRNCGSYGVLCTYGPISREMQLSVEGANHFILPPGLPYWQCRSDELIEKFQVRTALSVSFGERLGLYQNEIAALASSTPHLFHATLILTLMHDKHTSGRPDYALSNEEAYHWSRALSAFNKQLYRVPHGDEAAALLTTAAMVGIVTFQHIEATKPEEAWPLAPPSSSDLAWLRMTDGKKEVFKLTQQGTADPSPLLEKLTALYLNTAWQRPSSPYQRPGHADASALPRIFALYDIDPATKVDDTDDPLRWASARLAQLLAQDTPPRQVITSFLLLISAMRPDFRQMLHKKDPRALLLLAWWYTKTSQLDMWWLDRRSKLEGAAICMYLEREYPHDHDMQKLLEHPRSVFGLRAAR